MNTSLKRIINNYRRTLKECSYDCKNDVYLSQSDKKVLCLDKIAKFFSKKHKCDTPSSFDALCKKGDLPIFLIEFKNSPVFSKNVTSTLEKKIIGSIQLLKDVFEVSQESIKNAVFLLVVSSCKNIDKAFVLKPEEFFLSEHYGHFADNLFGLANSRSRYSQLGISELVAQTIKCFSVLFDTIFDAKVVPDISDFEFPIKSK